MPIEVEPLAAQSILARLRATGSSAPKLRENQTPKAGLMKTDQDNFIIDAPFQSLLLPHEVAKSNSLHETQKGMKGNGEDGSWEVLELARRIKKMVGVLEVGLFCGVNGAQALEIGSEEGGQKPVAAYFGMSDGSVTKRVAEVGMSSRSRVVKSD